MQPTFQLNKSLEENTHFLSEFKKILLIKFLFIEGPRQLVLRIEDYLFYILYSQCSVVNILIVIR